MDEQNKMDTKRATVKHVAAKHPCFQECFCGGYDDEVMAMDFTASSKSPENQHHASHPKPTTL